jgi:arabinose-5-phosphate isomerase
MLENIDLKEYKLNHSGGSIGNDLLTIEQVMLKDFPQIKLDINKTVKIIDIVIEMTNKKTGLVIINDEENNIKGIISDGDIRRLLINNQNLNNIFLHNINQKYYYESNKNIQFKNIKENLLKYKFIPIVENKKCIGLLHENLIKKDIYL